MEDEYDSPKEIFKEWCKYNLAKYGPNWKEIVSKQLTEDLMKSPLGKELERRANANSQRK